MFSNDCPSSDSSSNQDAALKRLVGFFGLLMDVNLRLEGQRRVLYRLPKLIAAREKGASIFVVEGEKDV